MSVLELARFSDSEPKLLQGSGTEKHQEKIPETKANTSQKLMMSEVPFQSSATDATVCN